MKMKVKQKVPSPLLHDIIRFDVRWRFGNMCVGGEFSAGMVCGGLD